MVIRMENRLVQMRLRETSMALMRVTLIKLVGLKVGMSEQTISSEDL